MKLLDSLLRRKPDVAKLKARRDVSGLLEALKLPEFSLPAAAALEELKPREAVEPLLVLSSHPELAWVRVRILRLLGSIGDARGYEVLVAALRDGSVDSESSEAAQALGRLGDPRAIEPLLHALGNAGENTRLMDGVAEALAAFGEPQAIEPLVQALRAYRFRSDRAIVDALVRLAEKAPERVVTALSQALESETEHWRWAAAEALGRLGDRAADILLAAVGSGDGSVRRIAVKALRERKDPRLRDRIEAILSKGALDESLLSDYQELGGDPFGPLTAAAQRTGYARLVAARRLGKCGSRAIPWLVGLLGVDDLDTRNAAADSLLGQGRIAELVPALLDDRTAFHVQEALLQAKHPAAPALVFPLFVDRASPARRSAAAILCENAAAGHLGDLGKEQLRDAMIEALGDSDTLVRSMAAETLGWLRDSRALPHLEAFLADERNASAPGLKNRGEKAVGRIRGASGVAMPVATTPLDRLVALYTQSPQGFVTGSTDPLVAEVRAIGAAFDASGGMDAMRAAHAEFASRCTVPGAARNLEHLWDGVGAWRG